MHVMTPRGHRMMGASLPARWCMSVVLVLAAVACSGTSSKTSEPSTTSTTPPETATTPTTIVTRGDLLGVWSGDWGTLVLRSGDDGLVVGAYSHDEGTVTGRMVNGVFKGWWCEVPSREPANSAGLVEFRFAKDDELSLDGRWQYGADNRWARTRRTALGTTTASTDSRAHRCAKCRPEREPVCPGRISSGGRSRPGVPWSAATRRGLSATAPPPCAGRPQLRTPRSRR
jgi:hypothetical protein